VEWIGLLREIFITDKTSQHELRNQLKEDTSMHLPTLTQDKSSLGMPEYDNAHAYSGSTATSATEVLWEQLDLEAEMAIIV
jgi:hypothetical protein